MEKKTEQFIGSKRLHKFRYFYIHARMYGM